MPNKQSKKQANKHANKQKNHNFFLGRINFKFDFFQTHMRFSKTEQQ